jgi:hypothetical protein
MYLPGAKEILGVPREVIEHALRLDPKIPLKRQKLRVISPQKELKDRLGDQRGGSEWEPIKILLEGD